VPSIVMSAEGRPSIGEEGVVMAVSRRVALSVSGIVAGAGLLAAIAVAPALAGSVPTATLQPGGCTATAHVDAQWGSGATGGEIITVTVANTAVSAATAWSVSWPLGADQRVVAAWNATVSTAGTTATAVNLGYNGALAPGGRTSFGAQLAGTPAVPTLTCANDALPASSASSSPTPPDRVDVTVREADSGRTVVLSPGQVLQVLLGPDYQPVKASGSGLTGIMSFGGYPTGQPFTGVYRAVAAGSVDLTSQTDYACFHTPPVCARPTLLWTLHVTVVGTSPTSGNRTVTVTTADNRTTVNLRVGDAIVVSLPSAYQPPKLSATGVLDAGDVSGGYPTGQPLVARYVATAPGQLDVSTITDGACLHQATPCPSPQIPWTVHVAVTA
jgi:hypothetical protein